MRIKRIRRQEEFKIPLWNASVGNLVRQSSQASTTELLCENSHWPQDIDCFGKRCPPQTSYQILNANQTSVFVNIACGWNVGCGIVGSGWCTGKLLRLYKTIRNLIEDLKYLKVLLCIICLPFLYYYFPFCNIIVALLFS